MIKILKDRHESAVATSQKELLELLRGRYIFAVYKHMLNKIIVRDNSYRMLQIIVAAQTPLSIEEVSIALASLPSHHTLEDIACEIKFRREDYVKALCGHFVRFIHDKVHLVHQTAREFLLHRGSKQKNEKEESASDLSQHSIT